MRNFSSCQFKEIVLAIYYRSILHYWIIRHLYHVVLFLILHRNIFFFSISFFPHRFLEKTKKWFIGNFIQGNSFQSSSRLCLVCSFDGIIVFVIFTICTCGSMCRVLKLCEWFFSEKKGFVDPFYQGLLFFLQFDY